MRREDSEVKRRCKNGISFKRGSKSPCLLDSSNGGTGILQGHTSIFIVHGAIESSDELRSYTQSGYLKVVRMGDWKLAFDMMGSGQLYNLAADPSELRNL